MTLAAKFMFFCMRLISVFVHVPYIERQHLIVEITIALAKGFIVRFGRVFSMDECDQVSATFSYYMTYMVCKSQMAVHVKSKILYKI